MDYFLKCIYGLFFVFIIIVIKWIILFVLEDVNVILVFSWDYSNELFFFLKGSVNIKGINNIFRFE